MPTVSREPHPHAIHLGVGWEIAVVSTFVLVIIAVTSVAVCQFTRRDSDRHGMELENGARSDKRWPSSIINKRRRRRKKSRKTKARDPDVTNDLKSEEIEEVESFEEVIMVDDVDIGGVSGSGQQQHHVDVPKPTRCN